MSEPLPHIWVDLRARVEAELGLRILGRSVVAGGTQNRLFRLEVDSGRPVLVKVYHRDRWPRLEREFGVLSLLGRARVRGVPRALLRSDEHQYGVYSVEAGRARMGSELSLEDVRRVGELAARLHSIAPGTEIAPRAAESAPPGVNLEDVPPAVDAAFSLAQQIRVIRSRYGALEEFARSASAYHEVRRFVVEDDVFRRTEELIARATRGVGGTGELGRGEWRVNSGDFGPQNLLFADDGQVTAVDWEAGGWDDPARLAMGFVAHATSEDLSDEARAEFLGVYAEKRGLSKLEMTRFENVGALLDLEWVAIYASAMTPEVVAFKEFANPDFDLHAYLERAANRARQRLERAEDRRGYRF